MRPISRSILLNFLSVDIGRELLLVSARKSAYK